jgi:hypothetical protein
VCVFCRGGERDELLVPFLTEGVSAGDRCLAVVDTSEPQELLDALDTGGGAAHRADQLTVLASREVYLTDRGFDMDGMLDFYGPSCGASPRAGPATTASARPGR